MEGVPVNDEELVRTRGSIGILGDGLCGMMRSINLGLTSLLIRSEIRDRDSYLVRGFLSERNYLEIPVTPPGLEIAHTRSLLPLLPLPDFLIF